MSGSWIKVEFATAEKPEILRLARLLKVSRTEAFGAAVMFWIWLDKNTSDGTVDGVVDDDVDALVGVPGFCVAMRQVGWAELYSESLSVPHFHRLNGESAKNRAMKSERQARWRAGKAEPEPAPRKPATAPKPKEAPGFEPFYALYPRKEARAAAERAWAKLSPDEALQALILTAIAIQTRAGCLMPSVTTAGRSTVPLPASWLNGKRWLDAAAEPQQAPAARAQNGAGWWSSDALMVAKAQELGVSSSGLSRDDLKRKIEIRMAQT